MNTEEYQISITNPSGRTLPSESSYPPAPFKSLKSLIKQIPSIRSQAQGNKEISRRDSRTIYSKPSSKSIIPPINEPALFTRSYSRQKTHKTINNQDETTIPHSIANPIKTSTKNVINFSDRRKIREMSVNRQTARKNTLNDLHQSNKFLTNDYNTITAATENTPISRNIFNAKRLVLLSESNGTCSSRTNTLRGDTSSRGRRRMHNEIEIKKLIMMNPYDKLMNNFDYMNNTEQLKILDKANIKSPLYSNKHFHHQRNNTELTYPSKGLERDVEDKEIRSKGKSKGKNKRDNKGVLFKQFKQSCIYVRNEVPKVNLVKRLLERKENLPPDVKNLIVLQSINWLWTEYSIQIEQLFFCYKDFKWYTEKHPFINKKGTEELMSLIKLSKPISFTNALFLSFAFIDHDKEEKINFNIVITILILTSLSSYQEKMSQTLEVWENSVTHKVKLSKIIEVVQMTFKKKKDIKKLIDILKSIYLIDDWDKAEVDKNQLLNFIVNDIRLSNIIQRNKINLENNGELFEDEIQNIFNGNIRKTKQEAGANPEGMKCCAREMNHFEKILDALGQCNYNRDFIKHQRIEDGLDEEDNP